MKKQNKMPAGYSEGSLPERFDSWVSHILRNLTYTIMRSYERELKSSREVHVEDLDQIMIYDPHSDEDIEEVILGETVLLIRDEKLVRGLMRLSPRKKEVLEGTVILGIPVAILAEKLDLDEQTVSNYKYESLRILRKIMEESEDE